MRNEKEKKIKKAKKTREWHGQEKKDNEHQS